MTKRIMVVPDVHGRTFWKAPIGKYIEEVDKVVFLGDYLDPYDEEGTDTDADAVFHNFMEIIAVKQQYPDKVILLKGNHDQHYCSELFNELAGGSRQDILHWNKYNKTFNEHKRLFKLAYMEQVNGIPYLFTHAGLTSFWLNQVNAKEWKLPDKEVSVDDPEIVRRINLLDFEGPGQELLGIVGWRRSWFGDKTGSVLWADIREHSIPHAPKVYGLNKVYQVFGHTRLDGETEDLIEFDNLAMIDSQKCFIIDEGIKEKIVTVRDYEKNH